MFPKVSGSPRFCLKEKYFYSVEDPGYNAGTWSSEDVYKSLKAGEDVFVDGFNPKALDHFERGVSLGKEDDYQGSFSEFKQATILWPTFGSAYARAGNILTAVKAYQQALVYLRKAVDLYPDQVKYRHLAFLANGLKCSLAIDDKNSQELFTQAMLKRDSENAPGRIEEIIKAKG